MQSVLFLVKKKFKKFFVGLNCFQIINFKSLSRLLIQLFKISKILQVTPGSPAYQSGLRSGDIVNQINHQPANLLSHQRASDLIKTSPFSVNLAVERPLPVTTFLTPPCSPCTPQTNSYTPVPMFSAQSNLSPTGSSLSAGSLYRPQHLCSTSAGENF